VVGDGFDVFHWKQSLTDGGQPDGSAFVALRCHEMAWCLNTMSGLFVGSGGDRLSSSSAFFY